ncbi:hypothetical protein L3Q82_015445 [Scortum barcoo]|uniref:Uncharacterized protein n=1 Tax=Scortum barcoo TaxID=214431 RepID=A0ACB8VN66_9TELE|nr:hypothetical protein L3Q82_015445 [Scortum barcoo]
MLLLHPRKTLKILKMQMTPHSQWISHLMIRLRQAQMRMNPSLTTHLTPDSFSSGEKLVWMERKKKASRDSHTGQLIQPPSLPAFVSLKPKKKLDFSTESKTPSAKRKRSHLVEVSPSKCFVSVERMKKSIENYYLNKRLAKLRNEKEKGEGKLHALTSPFKDTCLKSGGRRGKVVPETLVEETPVPLGAGGEEVPETQMEETPLPPGGGGGSGNAVQRDFPSAGRLPFRGGGEEVPETPVEELQGRDWTRRRSRQTVLIERAVIQDDIGFVILILILGNRQGRDWTRRCSRQTVLIGHAVIQDDDIGFFIVILILIHGNRQGRDSTRRWSRQMVLIRRAMIQDDGIDFVIVILILILSNRWERDWTRRWSRQTILIRCAVIQDDGISFVIVILILILVNRSRERENITLKGAERRHRDWHDFPVLAVKYRETTATPVTTGMTKRGAELSTDHHLVVSWIRWQRRKLDRPGRPKRIVRVCWERLAEPSVREVFNSHLRKSFSQRFRGRLETLSPSGPCSLPPLSTRQFEVVDARSLVPVVVAIPEPGGGHRKLTGTGRPSKPQQPDGPGGKTRVWEEFGEAMEEDYRNSASKRFWQTVRRLRRGKQYSANTVYSAGGELLTSTEDIVGRWKKYFEDLLNPTDLPSNEEAEDGDSEVDSSITQAEVTEVVRASSSGGKAPGVDEIRPEYLKSLDVVGLSWLTRLCNIAWRLGTVPLEWQTGVVVPLFKKGDRRVCSNYRGITLLSLPGKVYARVLERRIRPMVTLGFRRNNAVFVPGRGTVDQLYTLHRVLEGLWEFAQPVHMCFVDLEKAFDRVPRGILWGVLREYGVRGPLLRAVRSLYDRSRSLVRIAGNDVVLLASSSQDLQHVLERFAAECEAAGMRISTSKSEAMVTRPEKGGVPSPGVSHREEASGRPRTRWRDYVSRLAWERLGIPPEELEEVSGVREGLGISAQTAASATRSRIKRMKMDGWHLNNDSLIGHCPNKSLKTLQLVQNAAARVLTKNQEKRPYYSSIGFSALAPCKI